jgi:hypothetical protein
MHRTLVSFFRQEDRLVLLGSLLFAGLLFGLLHDRGFDDPYITYRYAVNVAQGQGFVYNAGERVLSTTAPLYALLLAIGAWMGLDIPLTSNALGCLSLALGGLIFWHLGKTWNARLVGMTGLLLYPTAPLLLPTLGAEVIVAITLILAGFLFYAQRRYLLVAGVLALATLIRADSVLAVGVLAGHCLLYRRHALPWRALLFYGLLLLPWFGFAWRYFGAPLPVTLAAKQQQGLMAISESFFTGFRAILAGYWLNPLYHPHVLLSLLGLLSLLACQRRWLILLVWNGLYIAAYTALGVTRYFWYYGPLAVGYVTLIGLGVTLIARLLRRRVGRRWTGGLVALLLLLLLVPQVYGLAYLHRTNDGRMGIYRTVGEWLRVHTPPDASIGTLEVGIIGYYAERRMIDFAGLLQPATARHLTSTTTYQDAALWSFAHFRPTHLVLHAGMLPRLEADPLFQQNCQAVATFEAADYTGQLMVYACHW